MVRFTKDGLKSYEWNGDAQDYDENLIAPHESLAQLRKACSIEDGVTLGDIFRIVQGYPCLMEFIKHYSWCWSIQGFHNQALLSRPAVDDNQLEYLEISAYAETDQTFDLTIDFHGIGKPNETGLSHYSVSLTPMNELAHLPVKVKPIVEIRKDFEKISECQYCFSLLEVLDAIYDDISFHGGPEETAAFRGELVGMMEDIKAGTAKTVPLDLVGHKPTIQ